jgi:hypothetical protein
MSETSIDIMKKAHLAESARWTIAVVTAIGHCEIRRFDGEKWTSIETHNVLSTAMERKNFLAFEAGLRAGLRALAEMEPSEEHKRKIIDLLPGEVFTPDDYAKSYILAVAADGEKS